MCGIAGFNFEDSGLLRKMCRVLKHRGPDDEGYFDDSHMSVGNTRLSIIDLEGGRQPIFNEDRSVVVVHNGEIYNYLELRQKLERLGHRFYTKSDTEVIAHSYEESGSDCCVDFNGIFAFALWDMNKQMLLLARDRCGVKPLYYTKLADGRFLFASEIKSIIQYGGVRRDIDLDAFHYYINLRFVPRERTLFRNVYRLLPGHLMLVTGGKLQIRRYWCLRPGPIRCSESFFVAKLREVLVRALKRNLMSDVPLGILLSGGLDSSAILAFASKVSSNPIRTFTMGFGEPTDEMIDASCVAQAYGADHTTLVCKQDLLKEYPRMIWYADMPKRNLYPFYIMREASKHVKVLLGGLGGDELFGGYEWKYQFAEDVEKERKVIPPSLLATLGKKNRDLIRYISRYGSIFEIEHVHELKRVAHMNSNLNLYMLVASLDEVFDQESLRKMYSSAMADRKLPEVRVFFSEYFSNDLRFLDQIMMADFCVKLPDDFLHVEDAMSMANSVEARVPFLDNELVDLAWTIPSGLKYRDGAGKYIFRKAMEGIVPTEVLRKEKRGFGGDVGVQFSREIGEYASQILPEGYVVKKGLIRKKYIDSVIRHKMSMNLVKHYVVIWDLLAFEIWYRMYILDQSPQPKLEINSL
jgi:asparagine synthase (glutamine-hydrolysing)